MPQNSSPATLFFVQRLVRFFRKVYDYDVHGLASEMSFTFLLTLFPLLVVFVSILSITQDPKMINLLTDQVGKVLPQPIFHPIDKSIENLTKVKSYKILAVSLVVSFFSSLTIFGAIGKSLRFISDDSTKIGFWRSQWINLRLLFISSGLLLVYFYVSFGLFHIERFLFRTWKIGFFRKYPAVFLSVLAFLIIVSLFSFYYSFISKKKTAIRESLPGAIIAASLWLILTFGFQLYLRFKNVGVNYSFAYDLLSKMVVLMLYAYFNSTFFIWGYVWNQTRVIPKPDDKK
ncbi:YihY/virulence factor BrkB family protein [Leptospira idonii]|uniref:YihY/virulence factor BrkB family protein n=1 Tax=Leptospira idonii TaxID=1193500 RepID=UPI001FE42693|nr:YihY/virulence factor BrkB family protein [Leptospira idonii]